MVTFTINATQNQITIPSSIKNNPKKALLGTVLTVYGLKLVYESYKTYNIEPKDPTYELIGNASYKIGGLLTVAGAAVLCMVLLAKNNNNPE